MRTLNDGPSKCPASLGSLHRSLIHYPMKLKPKSKRPPKENDRCGHDELLNRGLSLALQWGCQAPGKESLLRVYPWLRSQQANEINSLVQDAMCFGYRILSESIAGFAYGYANCEKPVMAEEEFDAQVRARYPWISREHLAHMYISLSASAQINFSK